MSLHHNFFFSICWCSWRGQELSSQVLLVPVSLQAVTGMMRCAGWQGQTPLRYPGRPLQHSCPKWGWRLGRVDNKALAPKLLLTDQSFVNVLVVNQTESMEQSDANNQMRISLTKAVVALFALKDCQAPTPWEQYQAKDLQKEQNRPEWILQENLSSYIDLLM